MFVSSISHVLKFHNDNFDKETMVRYEFPEGEVIFDSFVGKYQIGIYFLEFKNSKKLYFQGNSSN